MRLILIALVIAFSSFGQRQRQAPKGPAETTTPQKETKAKQNNRPSNVPALDQTKGPAAYKGEGNAVVSPPSADERLADYTKNLAEYTRWLAIFTSALIVVGALQFFALFWQGRILTHHSYSLRNSVVQMRKSVAAYRRYGDLTSESNEFTRQSILLTHRPKLIVIGVQINGGTGGFLDGTTAPGKFRIVNVGATPASSVAVFATAILSHQLGMIPVYEGNPGVHLDGELHPGESRTWEFRKDDGALRPGDVAAITNPRDDARRFHVVGFVRYSDQATPPIVRGTSFCRVFNHQTGRFHAVEDADYEHAD